MGTVFTWPSKRLSNVARFNPSLWSPAVKPLSFGMFLTGAFFLSAAAHAEEIAITNATVFDGTGAAPYNATVVIEDGKISSIDKSGAIPEGIETLDAEGKALLPGFYDLHVH